MPSSSEEMDLLSFEEVGRDHGAVPFHEALEEFRSCRMAGFIRNLDETLEASLDTTALNGGFLFESGEFVGGTDHDSDAWAGLAAAMGYFRPHRSLRIPAELPPGRLRSCLVELRDFITSADPDVKLTSGLSLYEVVTPRKGSEGDIGVIIREVPGHALNDLLRFVIMRGCHGAVLDRGSIIVRGKIQAHK